MIWYVRRITLTCNTAALVPRAACSSLRSPVQQWKNIRTVPSRLENKNVPPVPSKKKKYRPFPSWKKLYTVPSRREKLYAPSRPVEQKYIYRPFPSWQLLFTVPSRRDNFYLPSRPVVTIFIYRPVPSLNKKVILLYRPVPSRKFTPTVPSRPILASIIFIIYRPVPSRLPFFFPPNMSKQYRPVPSKILPVMEKRVNVVLRSPEKAKKKCLGFRLLMKSWKLFVFFVSSPAQVSLDVQIVAHISRSTAPLKKKESFTDVFPLRMRSCGHVLVSSSPMYWLFQGPKVKCCASCGTGSYQHTFFFSLRLRAVLVIR